jgi:hypothetical protein
MWRPSLLTRASCRPVPRESDLLDEGVDMDGIKAAALFAVGS